MVSPRPLPVLPAALALALAAAAAGCAPARVQFTEGDVSREAEHYDATLKQWTRSGKAYADLETHLRVIATFKSWAWTHAAVERVAEADSLRAADKAALKARYLDAYRARYEFVVAAWSGRPYWNNLDRGERSSWRIALEDDRGREALPEKVSKVSETTRKLPVEFGMLFPYIDEYAYTYTVAFKRPAEGEPGPIIGPETRWITLRFTGPLGRTDLVWSTE
jgi:hypothetical protein